MFFEPDLDQYTFTESTDAPGPELFFAPPPQHTDAPSPESFDQEVAGLDLDFSFDFDLNKISPTFYDSTGIPVISTPSTLTYYSTDSIPEVTSSHYSSDFTQSEYSIPSEIESYSSLSNALNEAHVTTHPDIFFDNPPSDQPLHPAEAQIESIDFGTSDISPNVGISPEDLFTAKQPPPTIVVPAALPVHVTPDSEAEMAPALDRPFKCPLCPLCKSETI
jgi:hypothetical protein